MDRADGALVAGKYPNQLARFKVSRKGLLVTNQNAEAVERGTSQGFPVIDLQAPARRHLCDALILLKMPIPTEVGYPRGEAQALVVDQIRRQLRCAVGKQVSRRCTRHKTVGTQRPRNKREIFLQRTVWTNTVMLVSRSSINNHQLLKEQLYTHLSSRQR